MRRARELRGAPPAGLGAAGRRGRSGELSPGRLRPPKLRFNSRRTCWFSRPGRGAAAGGARRAALRPGRLPRRGEGRRGGGQAVAKRDREGLGRGAEAAAAGTGVAEESLGFRTGWLFGCRLQEGKSNPQPNFARLARFDAQIPPPRQPRLPAALLLPGSLASWAGPGRAPRSCSRPLPVCVSCKSACSLLSKRCHRPLAAGAPRLLPRAPPPPPAGALLAAPPPPASGRAPGLPPARRGARPRGRPGTAAARAGARRTPRGPDLKSSGRREEVVGKERREGPLAGGPGSGRGVRSRNPHSGNSAGVAGPRVRPARTNESGLATGRRCAPGRTPIRGRTRGRLRPRKSGRAPGRWCADPGQGPWRRRGLGGLFLFSHQRDRSSLEPQGRIRERLSEVPIWGPQ